MPSSEGKCYTPRAPISTGRRPAGRRGFPLECPHEDRLDRSRPHALDDAWPRRGARQGSRGPLHDPPRRAAGQELDVREASPHGSGGGRARGRADEHAQRHQDPGHAPRLLRRRGGPALARRALHRAPGGSAPGQRPAADLRARPPPDLSRPGHPDDRDERQHRDGHHDRGRRDGSRERAPRRVGLRADAAARDHGRAVPARLGPARSGPRVVVGRRGLRARVPERRRRARAQLSFRGNARRVARPLDRAGDDAAAGADPRRGAQLRSLGGGDGRDPRPPVLRLAAAAISFASRSRSPTRPETGPRSPGTTSASSSTTAGRRSCPSSSIRTPATSRRSRRRSARSPRELVDAWSN